MNDGNEQTSKVYYLLSIFKEMPITPGSNLEKDLYRVITLE